MIPLRDICLKCARAKLNELYALRSFSHDITSKAYSIELNLRRIKKCVDGKTCKCLLLNHAIQRTHRQVPISCKYRLEQMISQETLRCRTKSQSDASGTRP